MKNGLKKHAKIGEKIYSDRFKDSWDMNGQFLIRLVNKNNDYEFSSAASVINEAFLKQVVARTDRPTITAQEIKKQLRDPSKEAFIATTRSNQIVGAALLTIEPSYAYIWCVSVATAYQGLGLGLELMKYIENRVVSVHKKKLAVLSAVYHPEQTQANLVHWYEQQGYQYSYDQAPSNVAKIWKPEFHDGLTLKVYQKNLSLGQTAAE